MLKKKKEETRQEVGKEGTDVQVKRVQPTCM